MKTCLRVLHTPLFILLLLSSMTWSGCNNDYDDTDLWNEVEKLQERIQKLEDFCKASNANIESIQAIISALEKKVSISTIAPMEGDKGYRIVFTDGKVIHIHHGQDGQDGQDGVSPEIGIKDMGNGNYAWTLNGKVLKDSQGNYIPVNGKNGQDGEDGQDGTDGQNAPLPQLKTGLQLNQAGISGSWNNQAVYLSVDNGQSWTQVSATGYTPVFDSVDLSQKGMVTFKLRDGSHFSIPRRDQIAALLQGKWYESKRHVSTWNSYWSFNPDQTWSYTEGDKVTDSGLYEYFPQTSLIVLHSNPKDPHHSLSNPRSFWVLDATENQIYLKESNNYFLCLMRDIPHILEMSEIVTPKEGIKQTVEVSIKDEFFVKVEGDCQSESLQPSHWPVYDIHPVKGSISFNFQIIKQGIHLEIAAASASQMTPLKLHVFNKRGCFLETLTIRQEGDASIPTPKPQLNGNALNFLQSNIPSWGEMLSAFSNMDAWYTGLKSNSDFKAPLNPDNSILNSAYRQFYSCMRNLNILLKSAENELPNGPLKAPLQTCRAWMHYKLAVTQGNIVFADHEFDFDNSVIPNTTDELFSKLIPELLHAIDALEEKKNNNKELPEMIMYSKDVARMALAKIYMYQHRYAEAKVLLNTIVSKGFYSLDSSIQLSLESPEVIWSVGERIVFTYGEVLLAMAECEHYTQGNATQWLHQLVYTKKLTLESSTFLEKLKEAYVETQANNGEYFAFLKRNKLAMKSLNLTSENYLLFPIPMQELFLNPNIVQNPGY